MKTSKQLTNVKWAYLRTGSLIVAFMLFVPYAFYLYRSFPEEKTYETFFFTFRANNYESVFVYAYYIFSKLIPLSLLLIWFTTCKHWWYHSIAIPISVYIFQLIGIINDDVLYMDEYEFIYSLPITVIVLVILYFIRGKLSIFLKATDIKAEMDEKMNKPILKKEE